MATITTHYYHHREFGDDHQDLDGMTVREALAVLRDINWGSLGGMVAELDDGTSLSVELDTTPDGDYLMGSQRGVRRYNLSYGRVIRYYAL